MVKITLYPNPATPPENGWIVKYRQKGSSGLYQTINSSTYPIEIMADFPAGTLFEGTLQSDCDGIISPAINWETPCDCAAGYSPNPSGTLCQREDVMDPVVIHSSYCFAPSRFYSYSTYEARVYKPGFTLADLSASPGTNPDPSNKIAARITTPNMWVNASSSMTEGPMNRSGVWIDSDCDGEKDPLSSGTQIVIGFNYHNTGAEKNVYVGMAGDNSFSFSLNGTQIASIGEVPGECFGCHVNFKIWHIMPITLVSGTNFINAVGTGDGTFSDSIAFVIYDNTISELQAATNPNQLNILFDSASLIGTSLDVAYCSDPTYSLDTSGGVGNYKCKKVFTKICNSHDI